MVKIAFTENQWRLVLDCLTEKRIALAKRDGPPEKTEDIRSRIYVIETLIRPKLPRN